MDEEQHILMKTIESFDDTYIYYDSDGDTYFKVLSVEQYLKEKKQWCNWRIKKCKIFLEKKLKDEVLFEYDW